LGFGGIYRDRPKPARCRPPKGFPEIVVNAKWHLQCRLPKNRKSWTQALYRTQSERLILPKLNLALAALFKRLHRVLRRQIRTVRCKDLAVPKVSAWQGGLREGILLILRIGSG